MALTKITRHIIKPNENYDTHNINSTGIITAISANFSGNVSIAGTLTYDDVTNVDSIGIISARTGINILSGGINVTGVSTFGNDISIADKIIHSGDTNTSIRFPAADTIRLSTSGNPRLDISPNGVITQTGKSGAASNLAIDPFSSFVLNDVEARLQLCATNAGSNAAGIILSNEAKHFVLHQRAAGASNRFDIGYLDNASPTDVNNQSATYFSITTDGKVGVGEDNVQAHFHVAKNIADSDAINWTGSQLSVATPISGNSTANRATIYFAPYGSDNNYAPSAISASAGTSGASTLKFFTNASGNLTGQVQNYERLRITSDGKVGINESSNINGRLHIQHDALNENILYATRYNDQSNDKPIFAVTEATMSGMSSPGLIIGNHNRDIHIGQVFDDAAGIYSSNTTGIRITSGGNVGIGTDNPRTNFQVGAFGSGSDSNIQLATGTSGASNILFGDGSGGTDWYKGFIKYNHLYDNLEIYSTDDIIHYTSGTERLRITADGNVGIAITDPEAKLHVSGGDLYVNSLDGSEVDIKLGIHATHSNFGIIKNVRVSDSQNSLSFNVHQSGTLYEALQINHNGRVYVKGNGNYTTTAYTGNVAQIFFDDQGTSFARMAVESESASSRLGAFVFKTKGSVGIQPQERLRITAAGEVLINESAARSYVDGAGNTQTPKLQVESDDNTSTAISLQYNAGSGAANRRASFIFARTADGTAVADDSVLGEVLFMGEGNSTLEKAASIRAEVDGTPGTNDMPGRLIFSTSADGSDSPTERVRITSDGKVGIGTDDPGAKLDVNGDIYVRDKIATRQYPVNSYLDFDDDNMPGVLGQNSTNNVTLASISGLNLIFDTNDNDNNGFMIGSGDPNTANVTNHMVISGAGKVGINSTSPETGLDVRSDDGIFIKSVTTGATNGARIQFSDLTNGTQRGHIIYKHSDNSISPGSNDGFLIGGTETLSVVRIEGRAIVDEKVGIGTDNPTALLHAQNNSVSDTKIIIESTGTNSYPALRLKNDARSYDLGIDGATDDFRVFSEDEYFRITTDGKVRIPDDGKFTAGSSDDLQIFHSSNINRIEASQQLYIKGANINLYKAGSSELMASFIQDGAVELYHNGNKKLETGQYGVTVTGSLAASNIDLADSAKLLLGTSDDLQIYHDGSNSYIDDNGTGDLQFRTINGSAINLIGGSEYLARFIKDGAVELYHNNSKKFETTSAGISVTGAVSSTGAIVAGASSGGVALTVNDGYGNANVTFNHRAGSPDIAGNSFRIETNVDQATANSNATNNPTMTFEGAVASSAGGSLSLSKLLRLRLTEGADFPGNVTTDAGNFIIGSDAYGITWDDSGDDAARVYADRANNSFNIDLNSANSSDITTFKIRTYNSMGQSYGDVLTYDTTFEKLSISEIEHNGTVTIDANGGGADVRLEASDDIILNAGENASDNGSIYFRGKNGANSYRFAKSGQTTIEGFLSFESLTTDRTFTFPDAGGTIALTSDISSSTNADTVDNLHAASFLRSDASDTYEGQTSGRVMRFRCVDGRSAGSSTGSLFPLEVFQNSNTTNSDAAMTFHIGGRYATYFGLDRETNDLFTGGWSDGSTKNRIWHAGNDGSGSGLDADTVDGIQGASFLRSDANDTATGTITFNADVNIRTALDFADGDVLRMGSSDDWSIYFNSNNWTYINQKGNGIIFQDNNTNVMRLEDSGVFRPENNNGGAIGSTTRRWNVGYFRYLRGQSEDTPGSGNTTTGFAFDNGGVGYISRASDIPLRLNRNNNGTILQFRRANVEHGRVILNTNAAPGVSYSTNSDYRLKENVVVLDNAINRVKQLLPKRFNFIGNTHTVDGFLAHEAQTVVPEAVDGTKDEMENIGTLTEWDGTVLKTDIPEPSADEMTWEEMNTDENGNQTTETRTRTWTQTGNQPAYQGIDQAKLVPLVTAALQEAIAKIEVLETQNANLLSRIEALE